MAKNAILEGLEGFFPQDKQYAKHERLKEIDVVRQVDGKIHVLGRNGKYLHHIVHNATTMDVLEEHSFKRTNADNINAMGIGAGAYPIIFYVGGLITKFAGELETSIVFLGASGVSALTTGAIALYRYNSSVRGRIRQTQDYDNIDREYQDANMVDLHESVKHIRIYQGSLEEVARELGRPLQRVDTGKPETYISATNTFWLRVAALCVDYPRKADAVVHCQPGSAIGTPVKYSRE